MHLAKGEKKTLRFAYGYEPKGVPGMQRARAYAAPADPLADSLAAWKKRLAYVKVPGASSEMHRELAWRSHVLLGHTVQNDYYGEKYTAQGSAYLYLHGADGVPRDQALYAVATSYLDPSVAKGNLRMVMAVTDAVTGQKAYSFTGYGVNEGASLHNSPSDVDLFFFVGLSEYLAATGDRAFLGDHVAFHPKTSSFLPPGANGTSVLDHVRVAFRHLKDKVGLGSHGLVRISDGDWSDGIVYEDLSPSAVALTTSNGESIPNSQMALYVLPLIADQIAALDPALAAEMRAYASTLAAPVRSAFGTRWFGRAWVRNSINQSYLKGTDAASDPYRANFIDLEAQPWGILAGALDANQTKTVLDEIETRLDADSPIGPRLRQGGQVWPAISQLMTWAYARHRPAAAWRSLDEHLYATHAQTFPAQWMGILEGPDGFDSAGSAGGTWSSPVTPMTDFPVANMNPEAMMFVGLLRTAGVEPVADGLLISPRNDPAHRTYTVDLPLLRLDVTPSKVAGVYRAKNAGSLVLHVNVPGKTVKIPLTLVKGQEIPFEVTY
jgi:Glycosyl hydrolase 36 superfamily, catalytic domain